MRVLMAVEQLRRPVPGGIGTYTRGLLQGLRHCPDVEVVLYASRGPDLGLGLPTVASRLPSRLLTRAWDRGLVGAPDKGFDVVHAVSLAAPPAAAPLSVMVHDLAWRAMPQAYPPRGRRWHEAALRRASRRARLLLVPSRQTAMELRDRRVHVVEEGCDHLPPPDHDGARALLDRLGVDGPFLLTVSTLEPRKNLSGLMSAYEASGARPPLVVVGPQGWGPTLAPRPGVKLAGFVDEAVKTALMAQCLVFVYVPVVEGWGLPATEAMAAGAPVVASPIPSVGDAALLVDTTRPAELSDAIFRTVRDERLRADLVARGRERAATLTWRRAAEAHVQLWQSL